MDQSLVPTFSWGDLNGPMSPESFSKVYPYAAIGPWMALPSDNTVIFEIITFLVPKHFKTEDGNGNSGKLLQMTFKMVIGNQWK